MAERTPGWSSKARSTAATHAAHVMPVTTRSIDALAFPLASVFAGAAGVPAAGASGADFGGHAASASSHAAP